MEIIAPGAEIPPWGRASPDPSPGGAETLASAPIGGSVCMKVIPADEKFLVPRLGSYRGPGLNGTHPAGHTRDLGTCHHGLDLNRPQKLRFVSDEAC